MVRAPTRQDVRGPGISDQGCIVTFDYQTGVKRSAVISECGAYRYALERRWGTETPLAVVGLNPSTADGTHDDPTCKKLMRISHRNGYGGLVLVNLLAYRCTDPKALPSAGAMGPDNDAWIHQCCDGRDAVAAWGAVHRRFRERAQTIASLLRGGWALRLFTFGSDRTKCGQPRHPLYLRDDVSLMRWN